MIQNPKHVRVLIEGSLSVDFVLIIGKNIQLILCIASEMNLTFQV